MKPQRLGVNVDHVATLRNARGEAYPDPLLAAQVAIAAGADGITIHLREDRRHIRDADVLRIRGLIDKPLNFEMAATEEMVEIALRTRPHGCCLVPEKRSEVTTEGGLDVAGHRMALAPMVGRLRDAGIRVSMFVDPDWAQLEASAEIGAAVVELHTGAYCHGREGELQRLVEAAGLTESLGLECHAGHGLT
ncbi:MAG: pyridoxine 5'-phosphate synthase, partial [Rhodospirillales bacterium]|nr:pyridoxine 5'-phosphate synthase [Rhodospirillales bacterium]